MIKLDIKPLSVNQAWRGRRFKTPKYDKYIRDILLVLPKMDIPDGYLSLELEFGFSSKASDIDNPVKPFIDCLQKKYNFDDKMIKKLTISVNSVKKGAEYIEFRLSGVTKIN